MQTPLMGGSGGTITSSKVGWMPICGEFNATVIQTTTEGNVDAVIPTNGTISNLSVVLSAAPSSTYSRTVTLYKNGVSTLLSVTISAAATSGVDSTHSITVAPGDYVALYTSVSGTPATATLKWGSIFTGTNAGESVVIAIGPYIQSSSTYYMGLTGWAANPTTTENYSMMPCPTAGVLRSLYVYDFVATGSPNTSNVYLRKNGANTALTLSFSANVVGLTTDISDSVTVAAGNLLDLSVTGSSVSTAYIGISMVFAPTTAGESIHLVAGQLSRTSTSGEGYQGISATETSNQVLCPVACKAYNLYVQVETVSNISSTITLDDNGSGTALTVTLSSASSGNDTSDKPAIAANDLLSVAHSSLGTYYQMIGYVLYVAPAATYVSSGNIAGKMIGGRAI